MRAIVAAVILSIGIAHAQSQYLVRRGEAAMLVLTQAGIAVPPDTQTFGRYPDLVNGEWYTPYILKAIDLGMIDANPDTGLLFPHHPVTRAEFLKMLAVAFKIPKNMVYGYKDIAAGAWYAPYAGIAQRYGLLQNETNPVLFVPEGYVTHAEAAGTVRSLFEKNPKLKPPASMPRRRLALVPRLKETVQTPVGPVVEHRGGFVGRIVSGVSPSMVKRSLSFFFESQEERAQRTRAEMLAILNQERAKRGIPPLVASAYLEKTAQKYAKLLFEEDVFSHTSPDGSTYIDRIRADGYLDQNPSACSCAQVFRLDTESGAAQNYHHRIGDEECACNPSFALGENLAKGQLTPAQAATDWMNSSAHKANILRREFKDIGIGIYGDVWVNNFGKVEKQGQDRFIIP